MLRPLLRHTRVMQTHIYRQYLPPQNGEIPVISRLCTCTYSMYDTQTNTILKTPYPTGQFYIRSALSPKQARTLQVFFALLQKVRKPIALFIELPKTEIELILI